MIFKWLPRHYAYEISIPFSLLELLANRNIERSRVITLRWILKTPFNSMCRRCYIQCVEILKLTLCTYLIQASQLKPAHISHWCILNFMIIFCAFLSTVNISSSHSLAILSVNLFQWKMCLKLNTWNEINGIHTKWISFNTLHSSLDSVCIQISGLEAASDAFNAFFTCLFLDWSTNLPNNKYVGLMTSTITTPFRFDAQIYAAFILSLQPPIEMDLCSPHLRGQPHMRVESN